MTPPAPMTGSPMKAAIVPASRSNSALEVVERRPRPTCSTVLDQLAEALDVGRDAGQDRAVGVHAVVGVAARDDRPASRAGRAAAPVAAGELAGACRRVGAVARGEEDDAASAIGATLADLARRERGPARSRNSSKRVVGGEPLASARATASTISARPWPTLRTTGPRCRRGTRGPSTSQTVDRLPPTMTTSWPAVAAMLVKPRQKLVIYPSSPGATTRARPSSPIS